jgi:molybdopterin-guanine dinucleotide biosynthesis protein A
MGGAIKPLIEIDGIRILDRQLAVLRPRVGAIVVSASSAPWSPVPVIADPFPDGGPLAGLAAALADAATPWVLALAGDMPWLAGTVIDRILAHAGGAVDVVVPRIGGFPEPLLAAYHARTCPAITAALARGERSPSRWIQHGGAAVHWVEEDALRELDPQLRSFTSVNEPADLG